MASQDCIDTAHFIELLQERESIWNHKLPNAFQRKKEQMADLAKALGVTGMYECICIIVVCISLYVYVVVEW
jgi:hypothetical protein